MSFAQVDLLISYPENVISETSGVENRNEANVAGKASPVQPPPQKKHRADPSASQLGKGMEKGESSKPPQQPKTGSERDYDGREVGKKLWIRWPEDNKFSEAVVIDYDIENGNHSLYHVKDRGYEWVDLNKIFPDDILWHNPDSAQSAQEPRSGQGHSRGSQGSGKPGKGVSVDRAESQRPDADKNAAPVTIQYYETDKLIHLVEDALRNPTPDLLDQAMDYLEKQKKHLNDASKKLSDLIKAEKEQPRTVEGDENDSSGSSSSSSDDEDRAHRSRRRDKAGNGIPVNDPNIS